MLNNRLNGTKNEMMAIEKLKSLGYSIIEHSYRCKAGEIDIIARDQEYLVFVEVKSRSSLKYGHPLEAIDYRKQNRIRNAASTYMYEKRLLNSKVRFDAVSIIGDEILVIKNAF